MFIYSTEEIQYQLEIFRWDSLRLYDWTLNIYNCNGGQKEYPKDILISKLDIKSQNFQRICKFLHFINGGLSPKFDQKITITSMNNKTGERVNHV